MKAYVAETSRSQLQWMIDSAMYMLIRIYRPVLTLFVCIELRTVVGFRNSLF